MPNVVESYSRASDDELIRLRADFGSLTADAQTALTVEMDRRGLNEAEIARREQQAARDEQQAIQEQRESRPWGLMFAQAGIVAALGAVYVVAADALQIGGSSGRAGTLLGDVFLLQLGIALLGLRGRLRATLIMSLILYTAIMLVAAFL